MRRTGSGRCRATCGRRLRPFLDHTATCVIAEGTGDAPVPGETRDADAMLPARAAEGLRRIFHDRFQGSFRAEAGFGEGALSRGTCQGTAGAPRGRPPAVRGGRAQGHVARPACAGRWHRQDLLLRISPSKEAMLLDLLQDEAPGVRGQHPIAAPGMLAASSSPKVTARPAPRRGPRTSAAPRTAPR